MSIIYISSRTLAQLSSQEMTGDDKTQKKYEPISNHFLQRKLPNQIYTSQNFPSVGLTI